MSDAVALPTPAQQQVDFATDSDRGVIRKRMKLLVFRQLVRLLTMRVINKSPYKTGWLGQFKEFIPGIFNGGTRFA
jgi:hypothetical protein